MARSAGGTYTSPIAPFQTGTVIRSNDMNSRFSDLETEMTDSLSRSGKGGMSAALKHTDGSAAIPSITFTAQPGIGFYRAGDYDLRFVMDAAVKLKVTNTAVEVPVALTVTGATTLNGGVSGNVAFDTSTLYVDATNNRVGVGTAAPNALLAVGHAGVVDAVVPVQINAGAASEGYFGANKAGALSFLVGYSNGASLGTRALLRTVNNEPISFYVNNTTHVAEVNSTGLTLKTSNPASTTGHTNTITPANITKAWAVLTTDGAGSGTPGTGTVTVAAGFNIASATINGSGHIVLTFASAFASANYACRWAMGNASTTCITFDNQTTTSIAIVGFVPSTLGSSSFDTSIRRVYVGFDGLQ